LSFFLKAGVLLVVRMSVGRQFQAAGPATLKARSLNITVHQRWVNYEDVFIFS